jgi:excisionase family DNA binding protein
LIETHSTEGELVDQLLNVGQAHKTLGISRPTLYRLIRCGEIAVVKIGSRTLFRADDLRNFVNQHVRPAATDSEPAGWVENRERVA